SSMTTKSSPPSASATSVAAATSTAISPLANSAAAGPATPATASNTARQTAARVSLAGELAGVGGVAAAGDDGLGHRLEDGEQLFGIVAQCGHDVALAQVGGSFDCGPQLFAGGGERSRIPGDELPVAQALDGGLHLIVRPSPRARVGMQRQLPPQLG